jgi:hypothetical protein
MAKSTMKLNDRISAALGELRAAYVPEATRQMLCGGILEAINILEGKYFFGLDCSQCGRALMKKELCPEFRLLCAPGDIASFQDETTVEPAAAEAGWGFPGPYCPDCLPLITDPLMSGLRRAVEAL